MINLSSLSLYNHTAENNPSASQIMEQAKRQALASGNTAVSSEQSGREGDKITISAEAQKMIYQQALDTPRSDQERAADLVKAMPSALKYLKASMNWMDAANAAPASNTAVYEELKQAQVKDQLQNPMEYLGQLDRTTLAKHADALDFTLPQSLAELTEKQARALVASVFSHGK
ncbi:hypothetical protein O4H49_03565 [Kiloniella laminariae]|uniref:DUF4142 domain-containing protein n=1 Tax=Kiloniella laminariae TaxID=454162 RepID=A0ABT4LHK3_9PROT|nr:hypothetical protein [Kiloniella laminariae]MCZ4279841.1 hypothetical protein [Kiloniella laminariae]